MPKSKNVSVRKSDANLPAEITSLVGLGQAAAAASSGLSTGDCFGAFTKLGAWEFGQEKIQTEEGSRWAINPLSLCHGWIHWPESGRPTERMVKATQPLPEESDLPEKDGEWVGNYSFQALCQNGEDEGQQVIFKGSSMGFRKAWSSVTEAIAAQAVAGTGEVVPVVELESDSYTHAKYGKIMTPDIQVKSWMTMDGLADESEEEPEQLEKPAAEKPKKAPARRRRVKK